MCVLRPCSVFLDVCDVLCLFYLNTCVCICPSFHGLLRECLRARLFRVTLPSSLVTAPPSVCIPDVIGALAVWIQNPKKTYLQEVLSMDYQVRGLGLSYGDSYRCLWNVRRGFVPLPVCDHSQGVHFSPNRRI